MGRLGTVEDFNYTGEVFADNHWWSAGRAAALQTIVSRRIPSGGPGLDVGAGNGYWARRIERQFSPMVLVEPDPKLQQEARSRGFGGLVLDATLPGPLPFDDSSFRFISCLDVVEHIDEDVEAVKELGRALDPKGTLVLTVPAGPHLWTEFDARIGHRRRYTRDSFASVVANAGLVIRMLAPLNVWLYPAAWAMRKLGKTGDQLPSPAVNRVLSAVFGSEGRIAGRWPGFAKGLSLICLAQKP